MGKWDRKILHLLALVLLGEDKSGSENPEPELLLQQDGAKPPGWAWDTMHPGTALHFHPKASYYYTSYSYAWSPKMLFSWPGWWKNPIFTGNNFTKFCYFFPQKMSSLLMMNKASNLSIFLLLVFQILKSRSYHLNQVCVNISLLGLSPLSMVLWVEFLFCEIEETSNLSTHILDIQDGKARALLCRHSY